MIQTPPPPREEDLDAAAPAIAEKALDLFHVILNAVRSSTRAGGHVCYHILQLFLEVKGMLLLPLINFPFSYIHT